MCVATFGLAVTCPHNSYVEFGQWRTLFHNLLGDFVLSDRFALCRPHKRWNAGHWDLCLVSNLTTVANLLSHVHLPFVAPLDLRITLHLSHPAMSMFMVSIFISMFMFMFMPSS